MEFEGFKVLGFGHLGFFGFGDLVAEIFSFGVQGFRVDLGFWMGGHSCVRSRYLKVYSHPAEHLTGYKPRMSMYQVLGYLGFG